MVARLIGEDCFDVLHSSRFGLEAKLSHRDTGF